MAYLVDTNVLLRLMRPSDGQHAAARVAIESLILQDEILCVAPQSIVEFWRVSTGTVSRNGYGLSVADVELQVQRLLRAFLLLEENPNVFPHWRRIVGTYEITGIQVFDARLVAVMKVHDVAKLLTFNVADFTPFIPTPQAENESITVIDPATISGLSIG